VLLGLGAESSRFIEDAWFVIRYGEVVKDVLDAGEVVPVSVELEVAVPA